MVYEGMFFILKKTNYIQDHINKKVILTENLKNNPSNCLHIFEKLNNVYPISQSHKFKSFRLS